MPMAWPLRQTSVKTGLSSPGFQRGNISNLFLLLKFLVKSNIYLTQPDKLSSHTQCLPPHQGGIHRSLSLWLLGRQLTYIWMDCSLLAASTSCFLRGTSGVPLSALPLSYKVVSGCCRLHTPLLHRMALWMSLYYAWIRHHKFGRTHQMDPNRSKHSQWLQNSST